jgi:hypothetical protein
MTRPRLEVAEVIRSCRDAFLDQYGAGLTSVQRRALDDLAACRTAALGGHVQVHPVQISQWKKQLLDGVETLFRDGRRREREEGQAVQAELYEKIGRLNMEIEWLKKLG